MKRPAGSQFLQSSHAFRKINHNYEAGDLGVILVSFSNREGLADDKTLYSGKNQHAENAVCYVEEMTK